MERFLQHYSKELMKMNNKDYVKMAILKHEETFKEQVNELHRLYGVQKTLMRDLNMQQNSAGNQNGTRQWAAKNKIDSNQLCFGHLSLRSSHRKLDPESLEEECTGRENDGHAMQEIVHECDIELTLATGGSKRRKAKDEVSLTSDSGPCQSSSSTGSGGETLKLHEWGPFQMPEGNMSHPGEKRSGFNMEEGMMEDGLKQPYWHFQCLSLKMS